MIESSTRRALRRVAGLLTEDVMGLLALAAALLGTGSAIFSLSPGAALAVDGCEWVIVGVFALELAAQAALAPSAARYLLSGRGLFDAALVVIPLLTLLPIMPDQLRNTPAFRLLRLVRAIALGTRARTGAGRARREAALAEAVPLEVRALSAARPEAVRAIGWDELALELRTPEEALIALSGVGPADVARVARALDLPVGVLATLVGESAHPRVDLVDGFVTLFVRAPEVIPGLAGGPPDLRRVGTLLVGADRNLLALSRERTPLGLAIAQDLAETDAGEPFLARVLLALLRDVTARYAAALAAFEEEAAALEDMSVEGGAERFLGRAFQAKRRAGRLEDDLRRLALAIGALASGEVALRDFAAAKKALFEVLGEEVEEHAARAGRLVEDLVGLIELHLNVVSYQMNRVMRLLAVVTTLALVPTVVGGLLGMNLEGNPWPATLPQVSFAVGSAMAIALYLFAVKGWLR